MKICPYCGKIQGNSENPCCICNYMIKDDESQQLFELLGEYKFSFLLAGLAAENNNHEEAIKHFNNCLKQKNNWLILYMKGLSMLKSVSPRRQSGISLKTIKQALELCNKKNALRIRIKKELMELALSYFANLDSEFFVSFETGIIKWRKLREIINFLMSEHLINFDDVKLLKCKIKDLFGIKSNLNIKDLDESIEIKLDIILDEIGCFGQDFYANLN